MKKYIVFICVLCFGWGLIAYLTSGPPSANMNGEQNDIDYRSAEQNNPAEGNSALTPSKKEKGKVSADKNIEQNCASAGNTDDGESTVSASVFDNLGDLSRCVDVLANATEQNVSALVFLLTRWVDLHFSGALDRAKALASPVDSYVLPAVIEYAATVDSDSVQRWLADNASGGRANYGEAFYLGLAKSQPQQALQDILVSPVATADEKAQQKQMLSVVLEQWAQTDSESALQWLQQQAAENPDFAETAVNVKVALLNIMVDNNNRQAEQYILQLPGGPSKMQLLQRQVQFLAELDGQIALDWAQGIDEANSREIAMGTALEHWAETSVAASEVIDFILAEPDAALQRTFLEQVSGSLAGRDSKEFASIFDRIPEEDRSVVAEKIVRNWVTKDFKATRNWVENMPEGQVKDLATRNMVAFGSSQFKNPAQAISLTQSIQNSAMRYATSKELLLSIASQDKVKARAVVNDMSYLSDAEMNDLRGLLE